MLIRLIFYYGGGGNIGYREIRGCQMKESDADHVKLAIPLPFPAFVLAVRELLSIRVVPNVCNNPIPPTVEDLIAAAGWQPRMLALQSSSYVFH